LPSRIWFCPFVLGQNSAAVRAWLRYTWGVHELRPVGTAYLALVTELLQRQRMADAYAGLWEAADLQWWYTRDPHPTDSEAAFWLDEAGVPVTAAVFTRWSASRFGCDVLGDVSYAAAWEFVRDRCAAMPGVAIEMAVAPEDTVTRADAKDAGFTEVAETYDITWLDAADRPALRRLPGGYELLARIDQDGPHPMIKRNGHEVEERLQECSLYDPELDLAVRAPDGDIAAYAMFWADERTGVGLVEPMRVESEHGGRGIAGALLRFGLDRLARRGCARLKVSHDVHNEAAQRLYLGAGFRAGTRAEILLRGAR
jgi:GNAT superfamily N-acetyltransferase